MSAVAVALALVLVATTSQPPTPAPAKATHQLGQPPNSKENPSDGKGDARSAPSTAPAQIVTYEEANRPPDETGRDNDHAASWWFNLMLVVFTFGLVGVGWLQYRAMKKQADYMRDALTSTKQAATAATSAAETAERALELSERADVLVEAIDLIDGGYDRQRHSRLRGDSICRVTLKNYGRTRAENLTIECSLVAKHIEPSIEPDIVFRDIPLILGAGKTFELRFPQFSDLGFDQAAVSEINRDSRRRFFIDTKISYADVFKHSHLVTGTGLYDPASGEFRLTHYEAEEKRDG